MISGLASVALHWSGERPEQPEGPGGYEAFGEPTPMGATRWSGVVIAPGRVVLPRDEDSAAPAPVESLGRPVLRYPEPGEGSHSYFYELASG